MAEIQKEYLSSSEVFLLQNKKKDDVQGKKQLKEKETIFSIKQKYKNVVLMEIYENENILHSVLTNRICSSASGLNAIVKRINEASPSPICAKRQGKFTLYSLAEQGRIYVEEVLLPTLVSCEEDKETVHNIFRLLSTFKDKNSKNWPTTMEKILDGQTKLDNYDDEGSGFIKEFGKYYLKASEKAEAFLDLAIVDVELKEKLIEYIRENRSYAFENCWEVLNFWVEEDALQLYGLIDAVFDAMGVDMDIDYDAFSLTNVKLHLEMVSDKIQATLLKLFFQSLSKKEAIELWLANGLDIHVAAYIAEKYVNCRQQYEQIIEERRRCV